MKLHYKIFKNLTSEPAVVQDIDGKKLEIHILNDTPYLAQIAGKGYLSEWTSDGKSFKVLVERGYYDVMGDFFGEDVNRIWVNFLSVVGKNFRKMRLYTLLGITIIYLLAIIVGVLWLPEQLTMVLVGAIVVSVIGNTVQSSFQRKFNNAERSKTSQAIFDVLGEERHNELIKDQETYYASYYKFEEEVVEETKEDIENVEVTKIENGDEEDAK